MLSPVALAFMRQFIPRTTGRHADGIIDYRPIGRAAGLSDAEIDVALQELTAAGYIAYGSRSRAVFLTESGIFWWRRMQRRDTDTRAGARQGSPDPEESAPCPAISATSHVIVDVRPSEKVDGDACATAGSGPCISS